MPRGYRVRERCATPGAPPSTAILFERRRRTPLRVRREASALRNVVLGQRVTGGNLGATPPDGEPFVAAGEAGRPGLPKVGHEVGIAKRYLDAAVTWRGRRVAVG